MGRGAVTGSVYPGSPRRRRPADAVARAGGSPWPYAGASCARRPSARAMASARDRRRQTGRREDAGLDGHRQAQLAQRRAGHRPDARRAATPAQAGRPRSRARPSAPRSYAGRRARGEGDVVGRLDLGGRAGQRRRRHRVVDAHDVDHGAPRARSVVGQQGARLAGARQQHAPARPGAAPARRARRARPRRRTPRARRSPPGRAPRGPRAVAGPMATSSQRRPAPPARDRSRAAGRRRPRRRWRS